MNLRSYALVTGAYWSFTITDGALRMLVLLQFAALGYGPLTIGFLFLLYEFLGVVANLSGGWLGTRFGLRATLLWGLALQVFALLLLSPVRGDWLAALVVPWVMGAQAISGVAKDLTKMSAKSALRHIVDDDAPGSVHGPLFRWVALLTGSKNTLKGLGYFVGGALLAWLGFATALQVLAGGVFLVLCLGLFLIPRSFGTARRGKGLRSILSKSAAVNRLSAARLLLFGARDLWFAVGLPLHLYEVLGWSFEGVGGFMAAWIIGYGVVQSIAPRLVSRRDHDHGGGVAPARNWSLLLLIVTIGIALASSVGIAPEFSIIGGLVLFGVVFAVNSSIHSWLILAYSNEDSVALDVGFYYAANAAGRLVGTLLSGLAYLAGGLTACLWASGLFLLATWLCSLRLPPPGARNACEEA